MRIEGLGRFYSNLEQLRTWAEGANELGREEMLAVGNDIVSMAKSLAPVDTGRLEEGIGLVETEFTYWTTAIEIYSEAPYSVFVEFGTIKMAERPFLRPAFHAYGLFGRLAGIFKADFERLFRT